MDVRYAWRLMRRSPVFAIIVIFSLVVGIGANVLLFGVVDAAFLKPVPIRNPEEVNVIGWHADVKRGQMVGRLFSPRAVDAFKAHKPAGVVDLITFSRPASATAIINGEPDGITAQGVSGNFFGGLGIHPVFGRAFATSDDRQANPEGMVSYLYWKRRFASAPGIVGTTAFVNGIGFTIAGVLPEAMPALNESGEGVADILIPVSFATADRNVAPDQPSLHLLARFQAGANLAQVQAELDGTFRGTPDANGTLNIPDAGPPVLDVTSGKYGFTSVNVAAREVLNVLGMITGFLLLIVCLNVANLLLARSVARQGEMAIRLSIGATRWRLMRQLMTEGGVICSLALIVSLCAVTWGQELLQSILALHIQRGIDFRIVVFAIASSIATLLLFSLLPAFSGTRVSLTSLIGGGHSSTYRTRSPISKSATIVQVALSVVLLFTAGLFLQTLRNVSVLNVHFDKHNVLLFRVTPLNSGYDASRAADLYREMNRAIRLLPGVKAVTTSTYALGSGDGPNLMLDAGGIQKRDLVRVLLVQPDFFEVMGIPLLRGTAKRSTRGATAVINSTLAEQFTADPIGAQLQLGGDHPRSNIEVVGIAADAQVTTVLRRNLRTVFLSTADETPLSTTFAVRTNGDPFDVVPAIRKSVVTLDPSISLTEITTQEKLVADGAGSTRLLSWATTSLGILSLLLSCAGIYGLTAFAAQRRVREIGIRMSLGATKNQLIKLVMKEHLQLVCVGLVIGLGLAMISTYGVRAYVYGVGTYNPSLAVFVSGLLLGVSCLAGYLPAAKACRQNLLQSLRSE